MAAYGFEMDVAQAGQKYDIRPDVVMSFAAEAEIVPGQPVKRGTDPEKQVVVADDAGFLGVALFTHALENGFPDGGASYQPTQTVSVLTEGAAYVESSVDDVVAGETAYVTAAGEYTNVEATNAKAGQFLTGGDTGALVVIQI